MYEGRTLEVAHWFRGGRPSGIVASRWVGMSLHCESPSAPCWDSPMQMMMMMTMMIMISRRALWGSLGCSAQRFWEEALPATESVPFVFNHATRTVLFLELDCPLRNLHFVLFYLVYFFHFLSIKSWGIIGHRSSTPPICGKPSSTSISMVARNFSHVCLLCFGEGLSKFSSRGQPVFVT